MANVLTKDDVYAILKEKNISFELQKHAPAFSMGDLAGEEVLYPEADAKNLFIRDNKKKNYYLITVQGDKRVDLKEFRESHGTRPLSFVSPEGLYEILGLKPGSVSPFGLLSDEERKVKYFIDAGLLRGKGLVGVHPNDNTRTIWMKTQDLIDIVKEHGNEVEILEL